MRTLAAILAYFLAAAGGLAAGYYATAPRAVSIHVEARRAEARHDHTGAGGPAELEAVAAFLAAEEQRAAAVEPAATGL